MKEALLKRTKKGASRKGFGKSSVFKSDLEDIKFWSCKQGDHIIDIIPYDAGANDPLTDEGDPTYCFEFFIHRDVGPTEDQKVICLAETYGEACPVCEHRRALQKEGADEDVWKPKLAKQRNAYNIVCYDTDKDEDRGVQVWEVAWFYMEKHLTKLAKGPMQRGGRGRNKSTTIDPNIAFADPDEGRSVCFNVETEGRDYPEFSSHQFEARDYQIDDEILDEAQTLDDLVDILSYDEVYELYWGEKPDGAETEPKSDPEPEKTSRGKRNKTSDSKQEPEKTSSRRNRGKKPVEEPEEEPEEEIPFGHDECPSGHEFGVDTNNKEECDSCPKENWEECVSKSDEQPEPEEEEPKEEEPRSERQARGRRNNSTKKDEPKEEPKPSRNRNSRRKRR